MSSFSSSFRSWNSIRSNSVADWNQRLKGVEAVSDAGDWRLPAHQVKLVDTSGAGDALAGVLAASLDRGMAIEPALRRANAAAALACTRPGGQSSLPDAAEIDAMLGESSRAEVL